MLSEKGCRCGLIATEADRVSPVSLDMTLSTADTSLRFSMLKKN